MEENEIRGLERKARALIAGREISPSRMDVIRSLLNNESLQPEERYLSIIDLIKNSPEKRVKRANRQGKRVRETSHESSTKQQEDSRHASRDDVADLYTPVEYADNCGSILKKYRHLRLFKIRYLVHRNNRFGIGIKKRLIPTRRMLKIYEEIWEFQNHITNRLAHVMNDILEDGGEKSPMVFNYLRVLRKWLSSAPLVKYPYNEIKWMERQHFEREFRGYVMNYFSINKIDPKVKEEIIAKVEQRLRQHDDNKKRIGSKDPEKSSPETRSSLAKEKSVYQFMTLFRSFLSTYNDEEMPLSSMLKEKYGVKNFSEFLMMAMEALVFQRILGSENMLSYWIIEAPSVSETVWDYAEEILKKFGKDQDSLKTDRFTQLQSELTPLETVSLLIHSTDTGENLVMRAADEHWRFIDKKHYNPRLIYTENFFSFIDSVINYFYKTYIPLMDGTIFFFKDAAHKEHESALFSPYYFEDVVSQLNGILNEMHHFRTTNPTLAVSWKELRHIMDGNPGTATHIWQFVLGLGELFYATGRSLQNIFEKHKLWVYNGRILKDQNMIRRHLESAVVEAEGSSVERPLPFHDCLCVGGPKGVLLERNILGKRILNETMDDGVFYKMMALCFQIAYECFNKKIISDMERRKEILGELKRIDK